MAMGTSTSKSTEKVDAKPEDAKPAKADANPPKAEKADANPAKGEKVVDTRPGVIQPAAVSDVPADSDEPIREPDADRVAMVSIDANGDPAQTVNYEVLVHKGESDEVQAAAHNKPGRLLGAKHAERSKNRDEAE